MITFMRTDTKSIIILYAQDKSSMISKMSNLRLEYEPHFISKIGEMQDAALFSYKKILADFKDLKMDEFDQFKPGPRLIDYINTYAFKMKTLDYVPDFQEVEVLAPRNKPLKIDIKLTISMQEWLTMEGARQGVNSCDLVREILDFYVAVRKKVREGEDASEQIKKFNVYMTKPY